MNDENKETKQSKKSKAKRLLQDLVYFMEFSAEASDFCKEIEKDYDEQPEFICYRLFFVLRMINAYCCQLAVNSLAEGDEKGAERIMAISNMVNAYSPIPLFGDVSKESLHEVRFSSDSRSRDSIIVVDKSTGKVFLTGDNVPDTDEAPVNLIEDLFGPIKKKDHDADEEEEEEDEDSDDDDIEEDDSDEGEER